MLSNLLHFWHSFSRLIDTGDFLEDKNLNDSYYLLYAAVDTKPGITFMHSCHMFIYYCANWSWFRQYSGPFKTLPDSIKNICTSEYCQL